MSSSPEQLTWPQLTIYPDIDRDTALQVAEDLVFIYDCIASINSRNKLSKAPDDPDLIKELLGRYGGTAIVRKIIDGSDRIKEETRKKARKSFIDIVHSLGIVRPNMTPEQKAASYDAARYVFFEQVAGPQNHDNLDASRKLLIGQYEQITGKPMKRYLKKAA